jgi:ribosomal protein S18 acetylase RimI-like enzyme
VVSIRRVTSDAWEEWRLLRRQALEEAPYAFGSTLAEWSGSGDFEQRWRERLDAVPVNLIADCEGSAVGMMSVTDLVDGEVEIISMWVSPSARGRGVGDALIRAGVDHAHAEGASRVGLDVAEVNEHAIKLYRRAGFADVGWATSSADRGPERRMRLDLLENSAVDPTSG